MKISRSHLAVTAGAITLGSVIGYGWKTREQSEHSERAQAQVTAIQHAVAHGVREVMREVATEHQERERMQSSHEAVRDKKLESMQGELTSLKEMQREARSAFLETVSMEILDSDYRRAIAMVKDSTYRLSGPNLHGSGFAISDRYIMTNTHILTNNQYCGPEEKPIEKIAGPGALLPLPIFPLQLPFPKIELAYPNDDWSMKATLFGGDGRNKAEEFRVSPVLLRDGRRAAIKDIQLLHIPPDANHKPKPVTFGIPKVGMPVIVIGNPYHIDDNVTHGRVSKACMFPPRSKSRLFDVPMVVVDAPINEGNSGGGIFGLEKVMQDGKPTLQVKLIAMSTWKLSNTDNLGGGIRADYIRRTAKKEMGLPLMSDVEVAEFDKQLSLRAVNVSEP